MDSKWRAVFPWALCTVVCALAVYVWGQSFSWQWRAVNAYLFFPVLGLLAFSIMWTHYVTGTFKNNWLHDVDTAGYFRYTSYLVLAAIVFHPSILIYQLYHDGFGLPPGSYAHFVGKGMEWIVLLGTASLFAFLAFELHRWYSGRAWWKYVVGASDVAMVAIFYHGLRLGTQIQGGWYHYVWLFYGATLVAMLARKYTLIAQHRMRTAQLTK
jgi:hypothetical protein